MHQKQVDEKKKVLAAASNVDDMYDMLAAYEQKVCVFMFVPNCLCVCVFKACTTCWPRTSKRYVCLCLCLYLIVWVYASLRHVRHAGRVRARGMCVYVVPNCLCVCVFKACTTCWPRTSKKVCVFMFMFVPNCLCVCVFKACTTCWPRTSKRYVCWCLYLTVCVYVS